MFERFIDTDGYLFLPHAFGKIKVDINGSVLNLDGIPAERSLFNNEIFVKINWYRGFCEYKLSEIIAHTFKPIKLPYRYWHLINVKHLDGNTKNTHPVNLVWKFPIGLGSNEYNGFAFIPMYSRFMINKEGVIFDTLALKISTGHYNKGYVSFSLPPDVGPRTSLKRHRGLCLAFTDYPVNVDMMQVNHIDGIKGNDWLDNLEWVTCSENKIHAVKNGLTTVNKPVTVINSYTNEVKEFNSVTELCKQFDFKEKNISKKLAFPDKPYVYKQYIIKYTNYEHAVLKNTNGVKLFVKNLISGEVTEYESIADCCRNLSLSKDVVLWRLNNPQRHIYEDGFLFKRKSDETPWYTCTNFENELLLNQWNKEVEIKNLLNGEIYSFKSQRDAAKYLQISDSTILQRLSQKNQPVFKDNVHNTFVLLKNKTDLSTWRPIINPEKEYDDNCILKKVLVKNIVTGSISEFESAVMCAKKLNILPTTLNWRLKSEGQKLYTDGLMFKYKDNIKSFATIDNEHLIAVTSALSVSNYS